jgi:F-type H+-transporting ATPase subunit gamma
MSDTMISLRRKIEGARALQSVVRTMKALAASSIGQYEDSTRALQKYSRTVELGLGACFRRGEVVGSMGRQEARSTGATIGAVVFGSDQGLVGQFNEVIADDAIAVLSALPGKQQIWAVGERVHARLVDAGLPLVGLLGVPNSVQAITLLVGHILAQCETRIGRGELAEIHLFFNRSTAGAAYAPVRQRLLPLDELWQRTMVESAWPTRNLPEIMGTGTSTLEALLREYIFSSLFRACAESLASENASRLAAMERAERNIDELLESLQFAFHGLRQRSIDDELFDVISGFESLGGAG